MRFESALEVQAQVFLEVFGYTEVAAAAGVAPSPGLFVDAMALELGEQKPAERFADAGALQDIALGVTEGAGPDDSRLAVLLQDEHALHSETVAKIVGLARAEADVLYIGRQEAAWTQSRNNPLRLGCSTSPTTVGYAGTMGCFCRDGQTGQVGVLSNNHVLANVTCSPARWITAGWEGTMLPN